LLALPVENDDARFGSGEAVGDLAGPIGRVVINDEYAGERHC
jgi:hypothetical protein